MFNSCLTSRQQSGSLPADYEMQGGNVVSILSIPQFNEGLGYALRNVPANHAVMITHRNAMQGAALGD